MLPTFEVFGLSIPMFGVMMLCGMLAAFVLLWYTRRFVRFTEDQLLSAVLWAIVTGFLGAKVLYWIVEIDQVIADPHYLIETLRTGFVFYGALIGGLLGLGYYSLRHKLPFFAFCDLTIPSLVLGQAFGRIGCFLAGCCYGNACAVDHPLAVIYPAGSAAPAGVPMLPTQLLESAFLFLLTIVLVLILKKKKPYGTVLGWYMVLYGVWRFFIEFYRSDDRGAVGALSTSQFLGVFIVLGGVILLLLIRFGVLKSKMLPEPPIKEKKDEKSDGETPGDEQKKDEASDSETPDDEQKKDEASDGEASDGEASVDEQKKDEASDDEASDDEQKKDEASDAEASDDEQKKDEASDNETKA